MILQLSFLKQASKQTNKTTNSRVVQFQVFYSHATHSSDLNYAWIVNITIKNSHHLSFISADCQKGDPEGQEGNPDETDEPDDNPDGEAGQYIIELTKLNLILVSN